VKKKIRAIQYGIGPIGASIARLLREKASVEIVGAIDTDPAKVGRDLGEVVGASDAPWGVKVSDNAEEILSQAADIVIAGRGCRPVDRMSKSRFLRSLDLRRIVLSLSHASGTCGKN